MPRRYGGYGYSYRGAGAPEVDPLAAAISGALDEWDRQRAMSEERAERDRQRRREEQLDRDRREERDYQRGRDAASDASAAAERRFKLAQEGFMETDNPRTAGVLGLVPSFQIPGKSLRKVMPSARERADDLAATVKSRLERDARLQKEKDEKDALVPVARQFGIQGAEIMSLNELKAAVQRKTEEQKHAREKELIEYREQQQARFREPKEPKDDRPKYLTPTGIADRAADLTKPTRDPFTGYKEAGLAPAAAADSARKEASTQGQAAYQAELSELNASMAKARRLYAGTPTKLAEAEKEYAESLAVIKRKYGVTE